MPFVARRHNKAAGGNGYPRLSNKSQPQARESRLRLKRSSNRPPIRQESQDMRVTGYELMVSERGVGSRQQSSRILWKPKALFIEKLFMATSLRRWAAHYT
jgi:hypothetical protein